MSNIINNSLTLLVILLLLLGITHIVSASEITGSLSSDGSTDTSQGAALSETNTSDNGNVAQNSGQIQGSVTQGRDNNMAAAVNASSWGMATWSIPLAVAAIAGLAFFLWRRKVSW